MAFLWVFFFFFFFFFFSFSSVLAFLPTTCLGAQAARLFLVHTLSSSTLLPLDGSKKNLLGRYPRASRENFFPAWIGRDQREFQPCRSDRARHGGARRSRPVAFRPIITLFLSIKNSITLPCSRVEVPQEYFDAAAVSQKAGQGQESNRFS
ncbi:hypothetical protein QBC42DRAFT_66514 [Cladorrhinum samala]|uniref:Secreted protein n=1 Tax=Cladorrhinum samala TaxID=585594 RepID=A0AAV9HRS6_9PEZI|nr:hypothetical protein QBC42DRAFT_66514 [Cladorrhinum samala]